MLRAADVHVLSCGHESRVYSPHIITHLCIAALVTTETRLLHRRGQLGETLQQASRTRYCCYDEANLSEARNREPHSTSVSRVLLQLSKLAQLVQMARVCCKTQLAAAARDLQSLVSDQIPSLQHTVACF